MGPFSIATSTAMLVGLAIEIMETFKSATFDSAEVVHDVEDLKSVLKSIENSSKSLDSILDLNHEREHEHELLQVIQECCSIAHELYANVEKLYEPDGSHGWSWRKKRLRWSQTRETGELAKIKSKLAHCRRSLMAVLDKMKFNEVEGMESLLNRHGGYYETLMLLPDRAPSSIASSQMAESPDATTWAGIGSGLLMAGSFVYLNSNMSLKASSHVMEAITNTIASSLPTRWLELAATHKPPNWIIFTIFVASTAVFTKTTFAWTTNNTYKARTKVMGWTSALLWLAFWIIMGVNAEELFLVWLPQSLSFGICIGSLLGRQNMQPYPEDEERALTGSYEQKE